MSRLSRVRVITWIILAFNLLVLVGLLVGGGSSVSACLPPRDPFACLKALGTTYGVWAIWLPGNIVLWIIWIVTRLAARKCSQCRSLLKRGEVACPICGHSGSPRSLRDTLPRLRGTSSRDQVTRGGSPPPSSSSAGSFEDW